MVADSRKHDGGHTLADFEAHRCDWVSPLAHDYHGYTIHEIPPNGQGIAALMALGILEHFDLRPGAIIRDLDLRRPIYRKTASYGHFGRDDVQFPWENTDKAADLRRAAGL